MPFWKRKTLKLPILPTWPEAARCQTYDDLAAVTRGIREFTGQPILSLSTTDGAFIEVPEIVLDRAIKWHRAFLLVLNLRWIRNSFDCDKYAKLFTLIVEIMCALAGIARQPLAARLCIRQVADWARIPATGGGHAIVIAKTPERVVVIEPQNGIKAPWSDYPNRAHVFKILLGG